MYIYICMYILYMCSSFNTLETDATYQVLPGNLEIAK